MEPVESIDYLADAEPAPGRLAIVERFVNTVDLEHGREMLSEPERLRPILGLDRSVRLGGAELERALELRAAQSHAPVEAEDRAQALRLAQHLAPVLKVDGVDEPLHDREAARRRLGVGEIVDRLDGLHRATLATARRRYL